MMKRLLTIVLAVLVVALVAGQIQAEDVLTSEERSWLKEHGPIKVGAFNDYPPFGFVDEKGRAAGISIDFWRALAAKLGLKVEFIPAPFKEQLDGLKKGRFDSLAGIFPLAERARFFRFTAHYYTINTHIFVRPESSGVRGFSDLEGLRVGAVQGDSGQVLAEKSGLKVRGFTSYKDAVLALGRAEVDAIVMDDLVVLYYRAKYGWDKLIIKAGAPVEEGQMTLPVRKGDGALFNILAKGVALVPAEEVESMAKGWLE